MAIKDFASFKKTHKLVYYDCIDASRAFTAVYPIFTAYMDDELPNVVTSVVHHTIRSGLLSLCRVWDEDARSLKDLISVLPDQFIALELKHGIGERVDFHLIFEEGPDWMPRLAAEEEKYTDEQLFSMMADSIRARGEEVLKSDQLRRLRFYRKHFLAHSTGRELKRSQIVVETDYRYLLSATIEIVDMFGWLLENRYNVLESLNDAFARDAEQDWQSLIPVN